MHGKRSRSLAAAQRLREAPVVAAQRLTGPLRPGRRRAHAGVALGQLPPSPAGERIDQPGIVQRERLDHPSRVARAGIERPAELAEQPAAAKARRVIRECA